MYESETIGSQSIIGYLTFYIGYWNLKINNRLIGYSVKCTALLHTYVYVTHFLGYIRT